MRPPAKAARLCPGREGACGKRLGAREHSCLDCRVAAHAARRERANAYRKQKPGGRGAAVQLAAADVGVAAGVAR